MSAVELQALASYFTRRPIDTSSTTLLGDFAPLPADPIPMQYLPSFPLYELVRARPNIAVIASPFDSVVDTKVSRARDAIARGPGSAVTARLKVLVQMAAEEYPQTDIPSEASIHGALMLFALNAAPPKPRIGLTSIGNIWAEWISRIDRTKRVALEFRRSGAIVLAAVFPDADEPMLQASQVVGNLSVGGALQKLRDDPTLRWIYTPGA